MEVKEAGNFMAFPVRTSSSWTHHDFYSLPVQGHRETVQISPPSQLSSPSPPPSPARSIVAHEDMARPLHPLPSLQGPFEESITDSIEIPAEDSDAPDAATRRRNLLQANCCDDAAVAHGKRYKEKPGHKYHYTVKLMAQIVFGMHLLKENQAKSNEEAVKIMQKHVNEFDEFLERTSEDFELAIKDIDERTRYLRLPLQHMKLFQAMLQEKKFRTDLVMGNEKIEKIIATTARSTDAAMFDIFSGLESTKELGHYLHLVESRWPKVNHHIADVFTAMRGNEHGWINCLNKLRTKGDEIKKSLDVLADVVREISKLAAAASRRNRPRSVGRPLSQVRHSGVASPRPQRWATDPSYRDYRVSRLDKPLPKEPDGIGAPLAVPHPVPLATRYEQPRKDVPKPLPRDQTRSFHRSKASGIVTKPLGTDKYSKRSSNSHLSKDEASATPKLERQYTRGSSFKPTRPYSRRTKSQEAHNSSTENGCAANPGVDSSLEHSRSIGRARRAEGPPPTMENKQDFRFARRISKRLKILPQPLNTTNIIQGSSSTSTSAPLDLARCIDRATHVSRDNGEKDISPTTPTTTTTKPDTPHDHSQTTSPLHPITTTSITPHPARSRFSLFLKTDCPPIPPIVPTRINDHKDFISTSDDSRRSHSSRSRIHRVFSLRNLLHARKDVARPIMA